MIPELSIEMIRSYGWTAAGAVAGLLWLIRAWRLEAVQAWVTRVVDAITVSNPVLGKRLDVLVWERLHPLAKWGVPVVLALLAGALAALTGQVTWGAALVGALALAGTTIGTHLGTKWVGSVAAPLTTALVGALPLRLQPLGRGAVSLTVPAPRRVTTDGVR